MEALSREFITSLPWELLYADNLVLMSDRIEGREKKFSNWMEERYGKQGTESERWQGKGHDFFQ